MLAAAPLLVGTLMMAALLALWGLFDEEGRTTLKKRARKLNSAMRIQQPPSTIAPRLRRETLSVLDIFAQRVLPGSAELRARLRASGTGWSVGRYGVVSVVVAVVTITLLMLRGVSPVPALLIGFGAGAWLPVVFIRTMTKRRQARFAKLFPDAIGLIVRGLKAGLPVAETILVVGREVADPVGEEFRSVSDQIKLGQRIEEALWAVARRLEMTDFNFFVITLSVQRETGGNLAQTLENLDDILRKRRQMRLKVKAMSSEAVASASIIGALPFVMAAMLYVVSKSYIMTLFTTSLGLVLTAIGSASLALGVFVMMRMVSFEI